MMTFSNRVGEVDPDMFSAHEETRKEERKMEEEGVIDEAE